VLISCTMLLLITLIVTVLFRENTVNVLRIERKKKIKEKLRTMKNFIE
jgi:hypothetical protein